MRRERKRLGELLIEAGSLTEAQLESALLGQKKSGMRLGQYLVQAGILNENIIIDSVSHQLRMAARFPVCSPRRSRWPCSASSRAPCSG